MKTRGCMGINYEQLESDARAELGVPVQRLKGLLQVWTMFMASHEIGGELRDRLDTMSVWSKHALTRTMVVEYAKPWGRNREALVDGLDMSFLDPVADNPLHAVLLRYRHNVAAHLGTRIQPAGMALVGVEALNDRPVAGRFEKLLVPQKVRINIALALGLNDTREIAVIVDHIDRARWSTEQEIRRAAVEVRDIALRHPVVLDRLFDIIGWQAIQPDDAGKIDMPTIGSGLRPAMSPHNSIRTLDGRQFIESIVTWESTPAVEIDEIGNGFRIQSNIGSTDDSAEYVVSFLDYQTVKADGLE